MKHSILSFEQREEGGIYLLQASNKTLLSLGQVFELGLEVSALPNFNARTFVSYYSGHILDPILGAFRYGLMPNDKIVKEYKHALIIDTGGLIQVVDPEFATRFIVDLDDSKRSGRRESLGLSYEEQLEAAHQLVDFTFREMIRGLLGRTVHHP